jgi:hypothetical protein
VGRNVGPQRTALRRQSLLMSSASEMVGSIAPRISDAESGVSIKREQRVGTGEGCHQSQSLGSSGKRL